MTFRQLLFPAWAKRLLSTPTAELSRWQRAARYFLVLCKYGVVQLKTHRAGQMAAALSFRTIFGMVPVIVMGTLIFRSLGGNELFQDLVNQLLGAAHLDRVAGPLDGQTLAGWAQGVVRDVDANINEKTIGVVGALTLAWAAIGLLTTIERCCNTICHAPENRPLGRRIPLYWTVLTVGPALVYLSFKLEGRFVSVVQYLGLGSVIATILGMTLAFLSTWLFLFGLYALMPNTRVRRDAAAIGSFVATIFWIAATKGFGTYVGWSFSSGSTAFKMLYGTLGLIPLFLLWVYFLWLVVLYGLEVTQTIQSIGVGWDHPLPQPHEPPPLADPASVIPLMAYVAENFSQGGPVTEEAAVEQTRLNARLVGMLLAALADAGILHRVQAGGYALARPPARITTMELLQVAQGLTRTEGDAPESAAWNWVRRFREAQLDLSLHRPLVEL